MDRASDSGSEGWGFESLPVCQVKKKDTRMGILLFLLRPPGGKGLEPIYMQVSGGHLLQPVQTLVATSIFFLR